MGLIASSSSSSGGTTAGILPGSTTVGSSTLAALGGGATSLGGNTASSFAAADAAGSSYAASPSLPSWLTTNPNSLMGELNTQYSAAPASILSASDTAAAAATQAATQNYNQGMRQSSIASTQMENTAKQNGGTGQTSSIVAGQMAEQAGQTQTNARVQIAQMQMGATEQAASLSSQIAGQMASLRSSYLTNLASANNTSRGQDIGLSEDEQSQAQQAAEYAANLATTAPAAKNVVAGGQQSGTYIFGTPGAGNNPYFSNFGG